MTTLLEFLQGPWGQSLGWTLIHSLWQISLVALLYFMMEQTVCKRSSSRRYLAGCVGLFLSLLLPAGTLYWLLDDGPPSRNGAVASSFVTVGAEAKAGERLELVKQVSEPEFSEQEAKEPLVAESSDGVLAGVVHSRNRGEAELRSAFLPFLAGVWMLGAAVFLLRPLLGWIHVQRLRRMATGSAPSDLESLFESLRASVLGRRCIELKISERVLVPSVIGLFKPMVILPAQIVTGLSPEQLRAVLAHELAHVRRHDYLVNLMQTFVEALLFYHPALWWLSNRIRTEREVSCDEFAAVYCESPKSYARALLALEESCPVPHGLAMAANRGDLRYRMERLLGKTTPELRVGSWLPLPVIGALVVWAVFSVGAADEEEGNAASKPLTVAEGELRGQVLGPDGEPLSGALVDVWTWYSGNETTTDSDGRFHLKGLTKDEAIEVRISKEGFVPHYTPIKATGGGEWMVQLGDGTYFEGRLLDPLDQPVANATIRAAFGPLRGDGFQISEVWHETQSDAEGRYRLYCPAQTYDFHVTVPGRGVARLTDEVIREGEKKSLDLKLKAGVRFVANVKDSVTGEPVPGFVLYTWRPTNIVGVSDSQGRLVLEGMVPGEAEFNCGGGEPIQFGDMEIYRHGRFGRWWSPDALERHQNRLVRSDGWQRNFDDLNFLLKPGMDPVTIFVEPGVVVTGVVRDPDGNPVAKATVAPAKSGSGNSITGDTRYSVETEPDGSYRVVLPASHATEYNLIAHDGKYQEFRKWANGISKRFKTVPGQRVSGLTLTLEKPVTLRGKVLTRNGEEAGVREVMAFAYDKMGNRYYVPKVKTQADGTFELTHVRSGKLSLQVAPFSRFYDDEDTGQKRTLETQPGDVLEGLELVVEGGPPASRAAMATRRFAALVLDTNGNPMPGVSIGEFYRFDGEKDRWTTSPEWTTDEVGMVSLPKTLFAVPGRPELRIGEKSLVAITPDGQRLSALRIKRDQPEPIARFELKPTVWVKGSLDLQGLGDYGQWKGGARLHVRTERSFVTSMSLTDQTFRIPLSAGTYDFMVQARDTSPFRESIDIPANHEQVTLDPFALKLSRLVQLQGQPAPELKDIKGWANGGPTTLAALQGRIVILDFWGYWCGPCIQAMPHLMALHDEYREKGVVVVAVHDDSVRDLDDLNSKLKRAKAQVWEGRDLPFLIALDGGGEVTDSNGLEYRGSTTAAYGIRSFPTSLLLDPSGNLVGPIPVRQPAEARAMLDALLERSL